MKKRFFYQAMYVCLLVNCLCVPTVSAKPKHTKTAPGTAIFVMAEQREIVVTTKKYAVNEPYLKLEMLLPQFDGLQDAQFEKKLNKEILVNGKARKKAVLQMFKEYKDNLIGDELNPIQFEYIENYTPIASQFPYYVVELFSYQYSGGAHGLSELNYLVLDTQQNKQLALKDLFVGNIDYRAVINSRVAQEIEARRAKGEFFFSGSEGFVTISEDQPFFINNKGDLVIVFNVYEIAPYAAGPQFIIISRESLNPYLK